jgi:hypothetical protein
MDGIWTAVGAGWPTREEAEWKLAAWRQEMDCRGDGAFRVRQHTLAAPPPWDEEELV